MTPGDLLGLVRAGRALQRLLAGMDAGSEMADLPPDLRAQVEEGLDDRG